MLIIGNGPLITNDVDETYYTCGGVVVENGKVVDIGDWDKIKEQYGQAHLDVKGKVIMPGFINAHHHIYSAFARGMLLDQQAPAKFLDILENIWWKIDRHLSVEQCYHSAMATYIESVKNGVTTIIDHHASYGEIRGSLNAIESAAKTVGVRTCLAYEVSDRDGQKKCDKSIMENSAFLQRIHKRQKNTKLEGLFGLHASFTLSDATLEKVKKSNSYNVGYHIHVSEGIYDEEYTKKFYGCSAVERLYKAGILGEKTLVGHGIHISNEDMDRLKETKTKIIYNPESNMGNGVGSPDILTMLDKGITVGLGTDGYTSDMLESLKVANLLQKHSRRQGDRGFNEAMRCLFKNNKRIASQLFHEKLGSLEIGAAADIISLDYRETTPMTRKNYKGHIMFGMTGSMVDTTIIGGEVIYKNRQFTKLNEREMLEKTKASAAELWRVLNE